MHPDIAKTKAMKEYNEHKRGNSAAEDARDATIGILSDSMVIAPLLQTAIYHSTHESKVSTYVYVFTHRSKNGEFPNVSSFTLIYMALKLLYEYFPVCQSV